MNLPPSSPERPSVPALHKAFAILDVVAQEAGISFTEIRNRLSLPKSSAYQLITTLCDLGALQIRPNGGYVLGLRLCSWGSIAADQRSIDEDAIPLLEELARATGLTCHLGVLEGDEAVYLAKVELEQAIKIRSRVGKRLSLYRSSLGKALLAWKPEDERNALLDGIEWLKKTPNSLPDADAVRAELALTRARGYATDDEEDMLNIRCVAAPVFDGQGRVIAAISAVGTVLQVAREDFPVLAETVRATAEKISRRLGAIGVI